MGKKAVIYIKESLEELELLHKKTRKHRVKKRIKSLILTKQQTYSTRVELAEHLSVDVKTLFVWTKTYKSLGLTAMINATSGGSHNHVITKEIRESLSAKLHNSTEPLQGYSDAVLWIKDNLNIDVNYHTLRSFMITNFGSKLKQPRKSHYKKDEKAFETFKKTSVTS